MITFANAKINIGLQVVDRRSDGYHNLETVFYPLKLYDIVEVVEADNLRFVPSGLAIPGSETDNLCVRAYRLLADDFDLPPVHIHLHKAIPIGAGLGGGSADAAFLLKLLNDQFKLGLGESQLIGYARKLGADCAFFIRNSPVLATGIGDVFQAVSVDLSGFNIVVVKPDIHVSTAMAYGMVKPNGAPGRLASNIQLPVESWRDSVVNDFESGIFFRYPEIASIKTALYEEGAVFAAMSGSGSAVYGLFREKLSLGGWSRNHQVFYID